MLDKIKLIVSQVMHYPLDMIDGDSSPDSIEKWDSITHINLVLALEQEFNIAFNEEQIVELLNVNLIFITINELTQEAK